MAEFDDYLDELDPCCQKEIIQNRKEKRIKEVLSKTDRSNQRNKIRDKILSNQVCLASNDCSCCMSPKLFDYPLLITLRENSYKFKNVNNDYSPTMLFFGGYRLSQLILHLKRLE